MPVLSRKMGCEEGLLRRAAGRVGGGAPGGAGWGLRAEREPRLPLGARYTKLPAMWRERLMGLSEAQVR